MNITDELRAYIRGHSWESLTAIADRIDAALRERYIELPRDADGQYIHIGDMMECEKLPNGNRVCGEVKAISNDCVWLINVQYKIHAKYLRHHREPTIEDVLTEFALEIDPSADIAVTGAETIKKYAAKLQLKEPSE